MKILILASNPSRDLQLDHEIRDLKQVIEQSHNRQQFEVENALAVRVGDLHDLLFRYRPQIVHFCGHGSGKQGLVFEGNEGGEQWVRAEALSDLFRLFSSNVGCVLLNACYSEEQANAIVNHIDYVIGMSQEIRDDAAIAFSKGFYRALGYDCPIEQAFEFGKNAIQLEISGSSRVRSAATEQQRKAEVVNAVQTEIPEHLKPILRCKPTLNQSPSRVVLGSEQPLSQAKREEIQLEVANALTKESSSQQQYHEKVREFLSDRKLTKLEEIRLEQLRKSLGLSLEEANQILAEEQEPIKQARHKYAETLNQLIEDGLYPFNAEIEANLGEFRQELQLTDEEVAAIADPILEEAEEEYQEKLKPYSLGLAFYQQGKLDEAITAYRQAIQINPNNAGAYHNLGLALNNQNRLDEAITAYRQAIQINPNDALCHHRLGFVFQQQGKLDKAITAYRRAIQINPNYADVHNSLGLALYNQGRLDEAITAYRQAIRSDPDNRFAHYNLGFALYNQGKLDEAITAYRQAIQVNPNNASAHNSLGLALYNQGRLDEAITAYRQAIQIAPNEVWYYYNLGLALYNQGRLDEAITAYRQAIQINPNHPADTHNGLGLALYNQGKLDEAITAYRQAIQVNPNHPFAHNNLGLALRQQGKWDEAIAAFRQAIQIAPNDANAHRELANALYQQGKLDEAIATWQRSLEINPNDADARKALETALGN